MMEIKYTDDALLGFKYYLGATQQKVDGFNSFVARSNFAADHPSGKNTFTGKALCGWATHPNQLKKDGSKMWYCPYRFAYDYFAVEKDKKIVYCVFTKEELKPLKEGETVKKGHYKGCPKHVNTLDDFSPTPIINKPKKYINVLDDF